MSEVVLWQDETAYLKRLDSSGGMLVLSDCLVERAVVEYLCERGFAIKGRNVVHLSTLGRRAAMLAVQEGGPMVRVPDS
ncbi:hypothetical protein VT03_16855 [Planctomyces sp. SH-PL14]|nr:hypothetical protein VT03_16855 [Planctomyces sp. SH-PL14]